MAKGDWGGVSAASALIRCERNVDANVATLFECARCARCGLDEPSRRRELRDLSWPTKATSPTPSRKKMGSASLTLAQTPRQPPRVAHRWRFWREPLHPRALLLRHHPPHRLSDVDRGGSPTGGHLQQPSVASLFLAKPPQPRRPLLACRRRRVGGYDRNQ